MRKSKFDQSPLPVQDSKYMNQDDNISEIENRVEFDKIGRASCRERV